MRYRYLAPVALALLLSVALWSTGFAQRSGQQTRTQSYIVVVQVGPPASPMQVVAPPMDVSPVDTMPAPEMVPTEEDDDLLSYDYDEDIEEEEAGAPADEEVAMPVQVEAPAMPMATTPPMRIPVLDEGQPVNRRLHINVADAAVGAISADSIPVIHIDLINRATGESRRINDLTPNNDVLSGPSEWNFGRDLFLPEGVYEMRIHVNGQTAILQSVVVPNNDAVAPAR